MQALGEIKFDKIWKKDFFLILDYPEKFQNRAKVYEILKNWETGLSELIVSGIAEEEMSDTRKLMIAMFDENQEKILDDIREALGKLTN